MRDLEAQPAQLDYHVRRESGAQLRMEAQVAGELAVLIQIFDHPILEFFHFLGSLQQRRIDFPDSDEYYIAKLIFEQLSNLNQSRETQTIIATD